ncbi:MAG: peptidoglycan D,D-transpeptidase FtsI family protein, partial [bacterium]
ALTDVFEPGSTMKPFTVSAALELGIVQPDHEIDTAPGFFHVGRAKVQDHHNLGTIDLTTLIRRSSNVAAGKLALAMPSEDYHSQLAGLGFGVDTGIGFPGEAGGHLTAASNWARIDQATLSFGYGISVTALQLAQAYAVLAADGVKRPVSLLRLDESPEEERVMAAETAQAVRLMMETVVSREGTAPQAAIPGYRVAGKTGTVRKIGEGGYSKNRYLSLFAGMVPVEDPRLVMVVMIDEPRGKKYYGGQVAGPVFSGVLDDALRMLNVPPGDSLPTEDALMAGVGQ